MSCLAAVCPGLQYECLRFGLPTYAPSSTLDTAAEIVVRAGEEVAGVDIRYRGESGHTISGTVIGGTATEVTSGYSVLLTTVADGKPLWSVSAFQPPNTRGFSFKGLADGEYDVSAQASFPGERLAISESKRIRVKGADVTGVELSTRLLPSITGRVILKASGAPECKDKRRPQLIETMVLARRNEKGVPVQPTFPRYLGAQVPTEKDGAFAVRNLAPGQYDLRARFFAKYWYLSSVSMPSASTAGSAKANASEPANGGRNWLVLKDGADVTNVTITLAEGAASLHGMVTAAEGKSIPADLHLYLVPSEREQATNGLRFYAAPVGSTGSFVLDNIAPGSYWAVVSVISDNGSPAPAQITRPDQADARARLLRAAEAAKKEIQLKLCENKTDFQWSMSTPTPR